MWYTPTWPNRIPTEQEEQGVFREAIKLVDWPKKDIHLLLVDLLHTKIKVRLELLTRNEKRHRREEGGHRATPSGDPSLGNVPVLAHRRDELQSRLSCPPNSPTPQRCIARRSLQASRQQAKLAKRQLHACEKMLMANQMNKFTFLSLTY